MKKIILPALLFGGSLVAQQTPAFEVTSVKAMNGVKAPVNMTMNPGGITFINVTILDCIVSAYGIKEFQVAGPDLLKTDRYEIVARTSAPATDPQLKMMLQSLLSDRFKLATHRESKDLAVYAITESKSGSHLRKPEGSEPENSLRVQANKLSFRNYSIAALVKFLSSLPQMDRPITDSTNLQGNFDFDIVVDAPNEAADSVKRALLDWATLFVDMDRQLGLKVEARKAPADMLIVDHVERPLTNGAGID